MVSTRNSVESHRPCLTHTEATDKFGSAAAKQTFAQKIPDLSFPDHLHGRRQRALAPIRLRAVQAEVLQLRLETVDALQNLLERQLIIVVLQTEVGQLRRSRERLYERLEVVAAHAVDK